MGRLRPSINRRPLYRGRRLNGAPAPLRLGSRHPRGQRIGSIRVEEPRQLFLTDTTDLRRPCRTPRQSPDAGL
jgi:hypothetical protein